MQTMSHLAKPVHARIVFSFTSSQPLLYLKLQLYVSPFIFVRLWTFSAVCMAQPKPGLRWISTVTLLFSDACCCLEPYNIGCIVPATLLGLYYIWMQWVWWHDCPQSFEATEFSLMFLAGFVCLCIWYSCFYFVVQLLITVAHHF